MPQKNKNYWWKDKSGKWHYHKQGTEPARGAVSTSTRKPPGAGAGQGGRPVVGTTATPAATATPSTNDATTPPTTPSTGSTTVKNLDKKKANYWWKDRNGAWHEHKPGMGVPNPEHGPTSYQTKPPTKEQRDQPVTKIGLQGSEYTSREAAGLKPGARPAGLPSSEKVKNLRGKPVGKSALSAKEDTGTKDRTKYKGSGLGTTVAKNQAGGQGYKGRGQYKGTFGAVTNRGQRKPPTGGVPAGVTPTKPAGGATINPQTRRAVGRDSAGVSRKVYDDAKTRLLSKKRKGYRP